MTARAVAKERPILFSGPMIRALLEGRKTQTRRIMKPGPPNGCGVLAAPPNGWRYEGVEYQDESVERCPYGVPGDRLWCRETLDGLMGCDASYVADDKRIVDAHPDGWDVWRDGRSLPPRVVPSIFMPRWASRITLEVTEVRVQRLQEISEEDAQAEGARYFADIPAGPYGDIGTRWSMLYDNPENTDHCLRRASLAFGQAWNAINGNSAPWGSNPYVWAITFRVIQ